MFLSDRIVGGTSAYSKVTYETCTRLAELGHSVAHIPMGRSNRMGKWGYQGVLIYPSGNDPWGEDVAISHYIDWKADMLITLKEPWCVPGETLVETRIGLIAIKEFIESGLWRWMKVTSINGFSKVYATYKIPCTDGLVEIKTELGKSVRLTKDNLIYVLGRGWVLPSNVNIADGILTVSGGYRLETLDGRGREKTQETVLPPCIFKKNSEGTEPNQKVNSVESWQTRAEKEVLRVRKELEQGRGQNNRGDVPHFAKGKDVESSAKPCLAHNKTTSAPIRNKTFRDSANGGEVKGCYRAVEGYARNREGIFCWNIGWGGVDRYIGIPSPEREEGSLRDLHLPSDYFEKPSQLGGGENLQQTVNKKNIETKTRKQAWRQTSIQIFNGDQKSVCLAQGASTLLGNKEEAGGAFRQIRGDEAPQTSWSPLWRGRDEDLRGSLQVERVTSVTEIPFEGWVYDLTTESGDFFANGVLIHNCFNHIFKYAVNFVPTAVIDHSPVSPAITSRLHTAFKVLAPSRFAQRELKAANIDSVYMPHGVDTNVYKPLEEHRAECKKMWFLDPDEFVVGIIAMNRSRKMIPRMLRGYKLFRERNPDVKSHLMLWTDVKPVGTEAYEGAVGLGVSDVGVNLLPEIMELGLGEAVRWPDEKLIREGIPDWAGEDYRGGWDMVKLYNSFDVLLGTTGGEAFFLPGVEAQSCGKPIVVSDYAAAPEICGAGLTVPVRDYVILNTPGTRYALADVEKTAEALTKILNADPTKLAKKARAFALRYDWNNIIKSYWQPFLNSCEEELKPCWTKEGLKTWA